MKVKIIAIVLLSFILFGCAAPTPEADLIAAVAVLDIVSALPNLSAADKNWISAAASGLSCSSTVLAKGESAAQEGIDIAVCFSSLPVLPAGDKPYIQAGIAAAEVFIALFEPGPTPAAIAANAKVRKMSVSDRSRMVDVTDVRGKVFTIKARLK